MPFLLQIYVKLSVGEQANMLCISPHIWDVHVAITRVAGFMP